LLNEGKAVVSATVDSNICENVQKQTKIFVLLMRRERRVFILFAVGFI
jgi:hypothetical protein